MTSVNVTCDVSRTFADKRKETSLVSACDEMGHWSPDVPDCIGKDLVSNLNVSDLVSSLLLIFRFYFYIITAR